MKKLLSIGCLLLLTGCLNNLHEVEKGKFYRSAQMSSKDFEKTIDKLGIKTVINLRGESTSKWWPKEKEITSRLGVEFINLKMSAQRYPHKHDLIGLLDAYRDAERPILIHCQGGADRTGEASAIYKMLYMGKTLKKSLKQLRIKFRHLKWRYPAKRDFIKNVWKGEEWAYNQYDPCLLNSKHYEIDKYCTKSERALDLLAEDEDIIASEDELK
jgi:protein tyrosine phosphatase (PTP) superfamily phosphohydrolase (DUF442 family)